MEKSEIRVFEYSFHIFEKNSLKIFFKLVFTPCKAEQPLRGMELKEKEAQKG